MIRSLLESIETSGSLDPVRVHRERCTHLLSSKSRCNRCVEHCPTGAISAAAQVDARHCVRCGACVECCPTEALELQSGSDGALHRHMKQLLSAYRSLSFVCSRASAKQRRREDAVIVPCLARVPTAELVLQLLSRGLWVVRVLQSDACAGCKAQAAMQAKLCELLRLRSLLQTSDPTGRRSGRIELLPAAAAAGEPIPTSESTGFTGGRKSRMRRPASTGAAGAVGGNQSAGASGFDHTRRNVLNAAATLPAHSSLVRLVFGLQVPRAQQVQPARNGALRGQLARREKRKAADRALRAAGFPDFFYPTVPRIEASSDCTLCSACSMICPTGALQRGREESVEYLKHDPAECIGCDVCVDLCPPQALKAAVAARGAAAGRIIAGVERECVRCGRRFVARNSEAHCRRCSAQGAF